MSNKDIGDIYRGMRAGNKYDQPMREKDLYAKVIREATIGIKFDDSKLKDQKFKMSDDLALSLGAHESKLGLPELFNRWCSAGGWDSATAKKAIPAGIVERLSAIYDLNDVNIVNKITEEVNALIELKESKKLKLLTALVKRKKFNVVSEFTKQYGNTMPTISNSAFIESLVTLSDFTEGNVGVGNGEVLITLYTEAVNPNKGDLMLPTGEEIELKGASGRPGKGDVVGRASKFEQFAMKRFDDFDDNRKQNEIFEIKEPILKDISVIYPYYIDRPDVHKSLKDLYLRLQQSDCCDYDEILKMSNNVTKQLTKKAGYNQKIIDTITRDRKDGYLQDIITKFNHIKQTLRARTSKPTGGAGFVSSYLSKYGFGKFKVDIKMQDAFATDLSKMAGNPKHAKAAILKILSSAIDSDLLQRTHITEIGLRILSAIQITDYAVGEGFAYYAAMCEVPGENYTNIYPIPMSGEYSDIIITSFNTLMTSNASIGASTGAKAGEPGRGGFTIKLNN